MKKLFLLLLILPLFGFTPEWGKVGHRTVGEIAQRHLTPEATSAVFELLDGESLSSASTWADEMRSNPDFDIYSNWHYVNLPLDKNYGEVEHKDKNVVKMAPASSAFSTSSLRALAGRSTTSPAAIRSTSVSGSCRIPDMAASCRS